MDASASSWLMRENDDEDEDDFCFAAAAAGSGGCSSGYSGSRLESKRLGAAQKDGVQADRSRSGASEANSGSCAEAALAAKVAATGSNIAGNNRLGKQQNRGNNSNGGKCNSSRGCSGSRSYSKIFRQYLPDSLNLNYALNINKSSNAGKANNSRDNDSRSCRSYQEPEEEFLPVVAATAAAAVGGSCSGGKGRRGKQQQWRLKAATNSGERSQFSKSIMSAFSRFKLSSSSGANIKQVNSRPSNDQFQDDSLEETDIKSARILSQERSNGGKSRRNSSHQQAADGGERFDEVEEDQQLISCNSKAQTFDKKLYTSTLAGEDSSSNNNNNNNSNSKQKLTQLTMGYLTLLALIGFAVLLTAANGNNLLVEALQQAPPPPFSRSQSQQIPGGPTQSHLSGLSAQAAQSQSLGGPQSPISSASAGSSSSPVSSGGQRPLPQPAAGSLVANINCNKIRGHVTLTPNLQGGTTVTTQITAGPPGEVYQWSVHQFPVKPGAAMCTCSPMILGTKLIDLSEMHGNLPSDQEFNVQSSLNLFGFDSPVGHSLMLRGMKTGMVACATFLPTSRKSNYRAKFHTPLSGSVTIFQTAFGTSFISHLMYSNGTRRHSMHRFDLVRTEDDIVTMSLGGSQNRAAAAEILAQIEQREHEQELSQCKRLTNGEALFKNMTYQLAVSTENFGMRGRTSMVLPQIPFETFSSVYLVIYSEYDPSEPIACAPLRFVKPKTAAAKFQSVSVQGSVVFSQDSPYDVTVARINLNLPNSDGHSYGIDELPMIVRRKSDTRTCPNIREIIYNPHHVEPSSVPPEGEATSDQYAVGDLSGKYGSLTGKSSEKIQVNDYNLPLFGPISIIGRAMTIYSAEGVAIGCSNVEPTTPMTTAFATFDFGIQGQFIFRQPVNDCNGDTYVYIEVSKPVVSSGSSSGAATSSSSSSLLSTTLGGEVSRSLDHNWHIHVNPVDSGLDHLSTTDCLPAGPHFNPYNTSTSSIYSRDCTPFNVLRCELGDLSAKMFTIEIPPYKVKGGQEPEIGKFFGTDIDLPLCGPVSIVNRSVVVHVQDFGAQRLACSTVIEFKPR